LLPKLIKHTKSWSSYKEWEPLAVRSDTTLRYEFCNTISFMGNPLFRSYGKREEGLLYRKCK